MSGKRGQVGLEYVMIVGAILVITIPLFFYALYETNYKVKLSQADDTVNTLANAADEVYSMFRLKEIRMGFTAFRGIKHFNNGKRSFIDSHNAWLCKRLYSFQQRQILWALFLLKKAHTGLLLNPLNQDL